MGIVLASFGAGCSSGSSGGGGGNAIPATVPSFATATFTTPTQVDNPFFTLSPGTTWTFLEESDDSAATIVTEVLDTTRVVNGVTCAIVRDREYEDGLLVEDTHDWYAQDDAGNVWYMGEEVINYEYDDDENLIGFDNEGAWEAGLDVAGIGRTAMPGHVMRANPLPGDIYHQEYYRGEAEDTGQVIALGVPITLEDGRTLACLHIRDSTTLPGAEPEDKFYAAGVGLVREEDVAGKDSAELRGTFLTTEESIPDFAAAVFTDPMDIDNPLLPWTEGIAQTYLGESEEEVETIVVEVRVTTRIVMGIECLVVRDRVFLDELLIEDTDDWYAQDNAGNVWYMGEEVINYEYDDDGNLKGTDNEGGWEAGQDVAGTGTIAEPGFLMKTSPTVGESYYQEYYPEEAEDMGYVVATGVEVELEDGMVYPDCTQILDWNPLEPASLEHKYFSPGVGLVLEEALHEEESAPLKGVFDRRDSVPDFAGATFSNPTVIDNTYLPLTVGTIYTYQTETEDGIETTTAEVLGTTKDIMGITCVIVQEVETEDDLVVEDTFDWYCQDDQGNVWYMGEDTTNYEYDDEGILIGSDNEGAWEAGQDIAGAGTLAQPGFVMRGAPVLGESYSQEYYEDEAEDMAYVVATGVEVELSDGTVYEDCLQLMDWDPLEPDGLEYKYYAPGVGLVLEEELNDGELAELVSVTP